MRKLIGLSLVLCTAVSQLYAQEVINAYAKVTGYSTTTLSLSNIDETEDSFEAGDQVIIMQMQDDVIGANTGDDNDFGTIDDIRSAGLYEIATLATVDIAGGEVTLTEELNHTYYTGANSSVQMISFPSFPSYATSDVLTALDWDGNVGGVLAMDVTGTLTLNNDVNLDGKGFRGGIVNPGNEVNQLCDATTYRTDDGQYGRKGEGIYKNTNATYVGGRGKIASGGGGGSKHNSGAGGGGNFTAGGLGGPGFNEADTGNGCDDDPAGDTGTGAGGYGGADLSNYISATRIFMGGGGGGGQQDNGAGDSEDGGDGGGILLIRADEVEVPCGTGVSITANGEGFPYPATDSGWDGAPGGGAGGTLIFEVNSWTLTCALTTEAKGGEGQSSTYTLPHGGGGGGGKGVSIFSGSVPSSNFTSDNSAGDGGSNGTGDEAASGSADSGDDQPENIVYQGGSSNGVIEAASGPLPVVLLYWRGEALPKGNQLYWATVEEINNEYFTIEKQRAGGEWITIAEIDGQGHSNTTQRYWYVDENSQAGLTYYRLSQTDYDGTKEYFDVIAVESKAQMANVLLYPNPSDGLFRIDWKNEDSLLHLQVFDLTGQELNVPYQLRSNQVIIDFTGQKKGSYLLRLTDSHSTRTLRAELR